MEKTQSEYERMRHKEDYLDFVMKADLTNITSRNYANYLISLFENK